jgi:hypothetical protein
MAELFHDRVVVRGASCDWSSYLLKERSRILKKKRAARGSNKRFGTREGPTLVDHVEENDAVKAEKQAYEEAIKPARQAYHEAVRPAKPTRTARAKAYANAQDAGLRSINLGSPADLHP